MRAARSAVVALVIAGTIAGTTAMSNSRHGDEHGTTVFNQALIGLPASQKIAIDGVPAAGAPWTVDNGSRATLSASGQLRVHVRGLLITGTGGPNDGTVGPVKQVVASLACASGVAATTNPVPLSSNGDAKIHATVAVPTTCLAPVVLVRIFGNQPANPWIAATGLSANGR